jgi:dTDP-4-amino-4,6-dideoxygalactose transaminase
MHEPKICGKPAVAGGTPLRESFLPLCTPFIGDEEKAEVIAALESGWLSTGPRVKRFEQEVGAYLGADQSVGLSSCTAGLHVALVAAGIGPGDEVITSPITFASTANVILHVGATPVFADVRPDTYNISVEAISAKITPRTRAIIPVHYAGQPCDMDEIMELSRKHSLLVIEDAAHGIGSKYKERFIGSGKDRVAVFSFYATKTMTTCEGGLLATGLSELADKVRILSLHGITHDAWKRYSASGQWFYEVLYAGYKYNMTDVEAALGLCQLPRLEGFIQQREEICRKYDRAFGSTQELVTPKVVEGVRHSRYIYPLLINPDRLRIDRAEFIDALRAENIGTSVHFIPVHLHPYYRDRFGYKRGDYPTAESVYDRLISLPLFPHMKDKDVNDVITAVRRIVEYYRA